MCISTKKFPYQATVLQCDSECWELPPLRIPKEVLGGEADYDEGDVMQFTDQCWGRETDPTHQLIKDRKTLSMAYSYTVPISSQPKIKPCLLFQL